MDFSDYLREDVKYAFESHTEKIMEMIGTTYYATETLLSRSTRAREKIAEELKRYSEVISTLVKEATEEVGHRKGFQNGINLTLTDKSCRAAANLLCEEINFYQRELNAISFNEYGSIVCKNIKPSEQLQDSIRLLEFQSTRCKMDLQYVTRLDDAVQEFIIDLLRGMRRLPVCHGRLKHLRWLYCYTKKKGMHMIKQDSMQVYNLLDDAQRNLEDLNEDSTEDMSLHLRCHFLVRFLYLAYGMSFVILEMCPAKSTQYPCSSTAETIPYAGIEMMEANDEAPFDVDSDLH